MADPEFEYLSPSFDPASLTVPRLRSILVEHDVRYPSSAKKADLIDIFTQNITPKAKRLLGARSRVKRSARGIEDVPSSVDPSLDSDESEEDVMPTPPPDTVRKTTKKAPRLSTLNGLDGAADEDPPTARRVGRPSSTRLGRTSDVEVVAERATPRSPSGRTRKSLAMPAVKKEDDDNIPIATHDNGSSPFTADNPFQSGSGTSPSVGTARAVSGERRRRTMGAPGSKSESVRTSSRRKTDFPTSEQPSNGSVNNPVIKSEKHVVRNKRTQEECSGTEDAGEEFTPEGQMEVDEARAQGRQVVQRPAKRRKSSRPSSGITKVAPWAISLAMLGGLATVWRQEKIEVGFCGVGRPSTSLAGVQIPEWANVLQPECEPCPPHAYCYSGMKVSCEPDFILVPHPLSLGGLVPLPPTCEPDGDKARKVKAVADRAVEELRERNAKWECGELKNEAGKRQAAPEMKEPELKQAVASKKRKSMSQEEFEELWQVAIGEISNRDEVEVGADGASSGTLTLRSTSLAHITLTCALRRSIRLALARHLYQLIILILAFASVLFARSAISARRTTEAQAKRLAVTVLERLALQAGRAGDEPWVSMVQLRDDVLREEWSEGRRKKVWEAVQKKVEGNANVRSMRREGRNGEVGRVWEWIGAVSPSSGAIEDGGSGRSSRFETPRALVKGESEWEAGKGRKESGVWDEGRPVY